MRFDLDTDNKRGGGWVGLNAKGNVKRWMEVGMPKRVGRREHELPPAAKMLLELPAGGTHHACVYVYSMSRSYEYLKRLVAFFSLLLSFSFSFSAAAAAVDFPLQLQLLCSARARCRRRHMFVHSLFLLLLLLLRMSWL